MTRTDARSDFSHRLQRWLVRARLRVLGVGILQVLVWGGAALLAAVWVLGGPSGPGVFLATGTAITLLMVFVALFVRRLVLPLGPLRRPRDLVRFVEARISCGNLLVAAEEARRLPDRWSPGNPVADELRRRLEIRAVRSLAGLYRNLLWPVPAPRRLAAVGLAVVVGWTLLTLRAPDEIRRGLSRLADPMPAPVVAATGGLYAEAGGDHVVAGGDLPVAALDFAGGREAAVCEVRVGNGLWRPVPVRMEWVFPAEIGLPAPARRWTAALPAVREDCRWRFRRGSLQTAERQVTVRHFPLLTDLGVRVEPPAYTRLPEQDLARLPSWFEVPVGSLLRLEGRVNHPVQRAVLRLDDGKTVALVSRGNDVSGRLRADRDLRFRIDLENEFGLGNESPVNYEVAAAPDQNPAVHLERPDDDGILPVGGELELLVDAADDFGLSGLDLLLRRMSAAGVPERGPEDPGADVEAEGWESVPFGGVVLGAQPPPVGSSGPARTTETVLGPVTASVALRSEPVDGIRTSLVLSVQAGGLELVPGDVLEVAVRARDNRRPGPPGTGRSRVLRLVLASAGEILAQQAESDEDRRSTLEQMRSRNRRLETDLDRLTRELMKNPLPDWSRQKEMEATIQRQQMLQKELAKVADQLQEDLDRLAGSQLTSEQLLEKADEVAELLTPAAGDKLQELLEKMKGEPGQASPRDVADAVREVARDQKDMARRLEAALAMLKRMAREQDLEGLTALVEKMLRKQQELADLSREMAEQKTSTEGEPQTGPEPDKAGENTDAAEQRSESDEGEPTAPSAEELARRQEALARELEELREQLQEALDELAASDETEDPSAPEQAMEQAMKEALDGLEEQQKRMNDAAQKLTQMDPEQAAQMQQMALRDLGALYHVLLQSQGAMQMAMEMKQVSNLRQLAFDLLTLSTRQEEISARIPARLRDVRARELARGEHRLQKSASVIRDRLSELMADAPRRVMALLKQLDGLIQEMGRCTRSLNDSRGPAARNHAATALGETNRIVIHLLTQAQVTGGGSGGSCPATPSLSEQLQKMAQEQAGLNGATEELRRMLADRGISQEIRSQMRRLGEEQAKLAGQARGLGDQEAGPEREGERLLGDLEHLGEMMERTSSEVDEGLISEETLVRQERILSRLLDARNSVRRRDYSSRRESRTADLLFGDQAGDGMIGGPGENLPLRLRFQPLEKAPLEYRDLVRRYFAAVDSLQRLDVGGPGGGKDLP